MYPLHKYWGGHVPPCPIGIDARLPPLVTKIIQKICTVMFINVDKLYFVITNYNNTVKHNKFRRCRRVL